ncbi:hypothetical protein VTJ04DRAFT_10147 [Mycothermus thermophilus]|uniref:uncharacterized protein n=1 Tax=Humicola insolens TaxID=85995 RepID=UPI003742ABCE
MYDCRSHTLDEKIALLNQAESQAERIKTEFSHLAELMNTIKDGLREKLENESSLSQEEMEEMNRGFTTLRKLIRDIDDDLGPSADAPATAQSTT